MQPFKESTFGGRRTLKIDSARIDAAMRHYRENNFEVISLSKVHGYLRKEIDFLWEHPYVTGLAIPNATGMDLGGIYALEGLRCLSVAGSRGALDLRRFTRLEALYLEWQPKLLIGDELTRLRVLSLRKYRAKHRDLTELPVLKALEELVLVQGNLSSLKGIGRFSGLRQLELAYIASLQELCSLAELASAGLEVLLVERCSNIVDHHAVTSVPSLRVLRFNACRKIQDIQFLRSLPNLEDFRFVGTTVVDGDLSPLEDLKTVAFTAKPHYSHRPEQFRVFSLP